MRIALINSRQDKAGLNTRHHIERLLDGRETAAEKDGHTYDFYDVEERLIHTSAVDAKIDCDLVIFLSRHSSVNPVPVLTVHVTGNYRDAELGGSPRTLAPAAPAMMQATLRALARHCPAGYRVSYEVTHHGPTDLVHPSFFVEIGSTEKEWTDPVAGRAVAESVLSAVPQEPVPLIGFGGTHYAARQTEIALTSRGAFGHIAHTREIATLDEAMVKAMLEQSGAVAAYIDRKAIDKQVYNRLTGMLDALPVPRLTESEITSLGHLSWDTYCAIRKMAGAVSPGARCFIHALSGSGEPVLVRANPVLLAETAKINEPDLLKNLADLPVVHVSTPDNRLLPEFITFTENSPEIIHALNTLCVKIIRREEITATENDCLIITKVRFDPQKARELGVLPGPSYKELAGGRPVDVDGRTITPDMVSSRSEIRVHIPGLEKFS